LPDLPRHGFADTATVAAWLGASPSWVRAHASELGAVRVAGLRFDVQAVRRYVDVRRVEAERPTSRRRPGPRRGVGHAIPADVREW
jgi:hypothetical protein